MEEADRHHAVLLEETDGVIAEARVESSGLAGRGGVDAQLVEADRGFSGRTVRGAHAGAGRENGRCGNCENCRGAAEKRGTGIGERRHVSCLFGSVRPGFPGPFGPELAHRDAEQQALCAGSGDCDGSDAVSRRQTRPFGGCRKSWTDEGVLRFPGRRRGRRRGAGDVPRWGGCARPPGRGGGNSAGLRGGRP